MYLIEDEDVIRIQRIIDETRWHYPYMWPSISSQVSLTEFKIQKWWASKIDLIDKTVNIFNSGFGFYSVPFAKEKGAKKIYTYDMCPTMSELISGSTHFQSNFIFIPEDIEDADVWINTSCEHCYPMGDIIPENQLCVVSGNDLNKPGHINLITSLDELKQQCNFSKIIDEDVMIFEEDEEKYFQYFVIGVK